MANEYCFHFVQTGQMLHSTEWQHLHHVNASLIKKTRGSHEPVIIHLVTKMWLMFLYITQTWMILVRK